MEIKAKKITLVPIDKIIPNPKNRNTHSEEQVDRLVKLIEANGFRSPLTISNQTGLLVAGHCRLLAAKKLKMNNLPVIYQDFSSPEEEYQVMTADNELARWATLDLSSVHVDIQDLGPFDLELLGIKDFRLEPDFQPGTEEEQGKLDEKKPVECPKCGHSFTT
jgi:hypothetical protein